LFSTEQAIVEVDTYVKQNGTLDGMSVSEKDLHKSFSENKGEYRFMEYNVLVEFPGWGSDKVDHPEVEIRKEITASMIKGYSPDVIVLCEMFENWSKQLGELLQDEYTLVEWSRSSTVSNRTPIAFKTSRFELIESGYTDIAVVESINHRVVTHAVLKDKSTGEKIVVFGTHLESTNEDDRLKQVPLLKAAMDKITNKHSGATVVLMGDFNTAHYKTDARAYTALKQTLSDMKNVVEGKALESIQHIYVSKTATVKKVTIETGRYALQASDHKPVIVDITTN
jgi:endonuclease/exonuclease/phosphatase family metal-dependent hydrolase